MEQQDSGGIGDLFDVDLEGLDFETAYELVNGKVDGWDDMSDGLQLNLAEDQLLEQASEHNMRQLPQTGHPMHADTLVASKSPNGQIAGNHSNPLEGLGHAHLESLLSVNESHAIESFLDSLLTASPAKTMNASVLSPAHEDTALALALKKEAEANYTLNKNELHRDSELSLMEHSLSLHNIGVHEEIEIVSDNISAMTSMDKTSTTISSNTDLQVKSAFEKFEQIDPKIPIVNIPDEIIPKEVKKDSAELRKWKHVYLEKQRRNTFKKEYDALIEMIRYPRPEWSTLSKNIPKIEKVISHEYKLPKKEGRRVPKHTLLNYIIEDIQLLLLANEELEQLYVT